MITWDTISVFLKYIECIISDLVEKVVSVWSDWVWYIRHTTTNEVKICSWLVSSKSVITTISINLSFQKIYDTINNKYIINSNNSNTPLIYFLTIKKKLQVLAFDLDETWKFDLDKTWKFKFFDIFENFKVWNWLNEVNVSSCVYRHVTE